MSKQVQKNATLKRFQSMNQWRRDKQVTSKTEDYDNFTLELV
jgi:hypothetical protein